MAKLTNLEMAQLQAEKCELKQAQFAYLRALKQAKKKSDSKQMMEAIAGLLRLAAEGLDKKATEKWDRELDRLMAIHPQQIPAMAWYCKGAVMRVQGKFLSAQRYFHRYLRVARAENSSPAMVARGLLVLAILMQQRGLIRRARWMATEILRRYESLNLEFSINGITYLLLGTLYEREQNDETAMVRLQKAHTQFLGDHNWFHHLYVLLAYARIARRKQNYTQARWYLDMVDKAAATSEFGVLRREMEAERLRLEQSSVDLWIDSRKSVIRTRERGQISLKRQYVLLHILEALSAAHSSAEKDAPRGLSKAEIIECVWKENYQSSEHDNRLYYHVNRLRKLIEPNVKKPQYLLSWKEGYRLAPELRIQYISDSATKPTRGIS